MPTPTPLDTTTGPAPLTGITQTARKRGAFARADLTASLAALTLLAALILAGASATRHEARAAGTQAQLRWIAGATGSYAADHGDKLWGLSWRAGHMETEFSDLRNPLSDAQAVQNQAVDIIRRREARDMMRTTGWFATMHYSHLALVDYLDLDLPALEFVSPEDAVRLPWARDRFAFAEGRFLPLQPDPVPLNMRWPFSSSYQMPPQMTWDPISGMDGVRHSSTQSTFVMGETTVVVQRRIADFAFPSQKVHIHASEQFGPQRLYFADRAARVSMLMVDGSAGINRTAEANLGWRVQLPASMDLHELYQYAPDTWQAPAPSAEPRGYLPGRYRFTRGGPAGRDFGGPEIDTSGW